MHKGSGGALIFLLGVLVVCLGLWMIYRPLAVILFGFYLCFSGHVASRQVKSADAEQSDGSSKQ